MIELSIHFTADEKDPSAPIDVRLFRADTGNWTDPAPFEPPLDDDVLADLRWYLEVFSGWPTGPDYDRAERIEARMEDWGRDLLASVTPDRESAQLWRDFVRDAAAPKLVTIDAVDPRVLRLPWELLADEGGHLFSAGIGVRRRLKKFTHAPPKPFDLPVRVLVVVSRPKGAGFIDPRAVSKPLLDALDTLGNRVETEFLYPPTLKALTDRLRASTGSARVASTGSARAASTSSAQGSAPPVHVVHFDGHGVYDARLGLGYLLFENEEHEKDRVDANRLGTLLNRCGVPLMVLNACQSAAQEEADPYASVAARLIRAGVGSVLAMNYSVLVEAARRFVAAFYGGLSKGLSVGQAIDEGRYDLLSDDRRHTITRRDEHGNLVEETITLRDWFLPALYQQSADPVVFTQQTWEVSKTSEVSRLPRALTDPDVPGGLPPRPRHGFHGRAREMLKLERTLAERRVVVLHGFGGMGKTALAAEAGRWFHRTGRFPGGAAFVSFEHGGSLAQLCSWVAQAVSGDEDYLLHLGDEVAHDPVAAVAELLRREPALVILDNFESVIGPDPLIPAEELQAILDAVWSWATNPSPAPGERLGEGARLLITTRDTTFNDARFSPSRRCAHVPLGGLATPDALELAAAVLDDHGIDRAAIPRQALVDLMAHLGGHPLSLYLVLPHLRDHTPAELTNSFEELLPGFVEGKAVERNESLAVSLEFSLRRLGEETRAALPDLAVFQGRCFEDDMLAITEMDEALWREARAELEQAALITVERVPGVNPPFLRFHPTLAPYLATRLADERRAVLEERYWQRYYALANDLYHADTQHPHQARAIALRELPNLRHALDLALGAATSLPVEDPATSLPVGGTEGGRIATQVVDFADSIARFLDNFGRWREREAMMEEVENGEWRMENGEEGVTKAEFLLLDRRGDSLLQQGRAAEAERLFRGLLERLESEPAYDADYDRAKTLVRLGRCLAAQGRPAQAIGYHQRALEEFERIASERESEGASQRGGESARGRESESARRMASTVYTDLGDNLLSVGQFDRAQEAYEEGLRTARELDDHRGVGASLGQLGTLALRRGELEEARERYTGALETFRALGEPQMEATAWHQLGRVAQERAERGSGDWDEAERCYRESLKLEEQMNNPKGVAETCNQLAIVAEGAGRHADAEQWYLRAQELKDQVAPQDASTLNNLAGLYLSQGRLEEAERYARRALEIDEAIGDPSVEIWKDYALQAQIAEARGRAEEAARWRRQEQESYAAYAGAAHQMQQYEPLIAAVVRAVQGDAEAMAFVEGEYPKMQAGGERWQRVAGAIRRVLAGERDVDALAMGMDRETGFIIRTILAQLSGEASPTSPAAQPAPSREEEAQAALAQLRQQWAPVVQAVVAACGGNQQAAAQLGPLLADMEQQDDWRALAAVLRRVLEGERDPQALLPGLDPTDTLIVGAVLRGLGLEPGTPPLAQQPSGLGEGAISLDELLNLVALARTGQGPPELGEQLYGLTQKLSRDPDVPAELQALGRALNRILCGDRDPDLSALPPELAAAVRRLLGAIG